MKRLLKFFEIAKNWQHSTIKNFLFFINNDDLPFKLTKISLWNFTLFISVQNKYETLM